MTKHKHHDAIIAWLNGEQIQTQDRNSKEFFDLETLENNPILPNFHNHIVYRVKPKPITVRKHIEYMFYDGDNCWTPDTKKPNFEFEFDPDTKKLLSCRLL